MPNGLAALAKEIPALSATYDPELLAAAAAGDDGVEAARPLSLAALVR